MLTKLIPYELKKSVGTKFFLIALCLLLLVNMAWMGISPSWDDYQEVIHNKEIFPNGIPEENRLSLWQILQGKRSDTEKDRTVYQLLSHLSREEFLDFQREMSRRYGEEVLTAVGAVAIMDEESYSYFSECTDRDVLFAYHDLMKRNMDRKASDAKVIQAAKAYGREALEEQDDYEIRRNLQILDLYEGNRGTITSPVRGWEIFLFESPTMLLVYLMILLVCAGIVSGENDGQTWVLLQTAKYGTGKTLLAKYLAGMLVSAIVTILFQITSLVSVAFQTGLLGCNQPAAAMEELENIPFAISVWQYGTMQLGFQILSAAILSVLFTTISAVSKSSIMAYAAAAILLNILLLPLYLPVHNPILWGPLSYGNILIYFQSYLTADFFGFPVFWAAAQGILWTVIGAVCILLTLKFSMRKRGAL